MRFVAIVSQLKSAQRVVEALAIDSCSFRYLASGGRREKYAQILFGRILGRYAVVVAFENSRTMPSHILLPPPTYTVAGPPLFVADFNGDGKPDLLGGSSSSLQLGNGDGTFAKALPVQGAVLAVADFNGDGKPDLLEQGTGTLLVLLGKGDGTFQAPTSTNTGAGSLYPVVAGDLRGNGILDVLGLYNNNLVVFLGKADGTFAAGVSYPVGNTGFAQQAITLGDFNGDSKLDAAVSLSGNNTTGQEVVLLGNGDGTFQVSPKTSTGVPSLSSVVSGDFNGDGKLDLAMAGFTDGSCGSLVQFAVAILRGNGDGTFAAPTTVFCGNGALAAADLNGDGKLDLVFDGQLDSAFPPSLVQIYLGNGDGTFSNPYSYEPYHGGAVVIADFNLDGKPDIAAASLVLLGNGNGSFQGQPAVPLPVAPTVAVTGDFAKNGTQDVAVVSNGLNILHNDGTGVLTVAHTYMLQHQAAGIATADLNRDGNLDLVVGGNGVLLGNGDGSFQSPIFNLLGVGGSTIVVSDFNNDHIPDLAFSADQGNSAAVLLGKGDGTFGTPNYVFDGGGAALVAADFNGDGKIDLASSNFSSGQNVFAILFGNGDGTFQAASFPPAEASCGASFAVDLNRDGKVDLVGENGSEIQVCLGNGDGTFTPLSPFGQGFNSFTTVSAIADINGDGIPDLVAEQIFGGGFRSVTDGVYLGNGDGTFGPFIQSYGFGVLDPAESFQLPADMNGDGKPDLVLGSQVGSVFVVVNTTPKGFTVSATALSPATIVAGNSATSTVSVMPNFGFNQTVTLSCSSITLNGAPAATAPPSCSFSPASVTNGSGTSKLTISTKASSALLALDVTHPPGLFYAMLLPILGVGLMGTGFGPRKKKWLGILLGCLLISGLMLLSACGGAGSGGGGGGGGGGTPAGTYSVTISGAAGSVVQKTTVTLIVQ